MDQVMVTYNDASHEIAALVSAGWKPLSASSAKGKSTEGRSLVQVEELATTCRKSLERLRTLGTAEKARDIEKAAVSLAAKLVALELVRRYERAPIVL